MLLLLVHKMHTLFLYYILQQKFIRIIVLKFKVGNKLLKIILLKDYESRHCLSALQPIYKGILKTHKICYILDHDPQNVALSRKIFFRTCVFFFTLIELFSREILCVLSMFLSFSTFYTGKMINHDRWTGGDTQQRRKRKKKRQFDICCKTGHFVSQ